MADNSAPLMALAFVEALILEDGMKAHTIAQATDPNDLGEMFTVVAKITAALLDSTFGTEGAVARVGKWRAAFLNPSEAAEWVE